MNRTAQEGNATGLLENPLRYPGLPRKKSPKVLLRVWRYPAFEPHCSWTVIEDKKQYFLRRVVWDQRTGGISPDAKKMYGAEAQLDESVLDALQEGLWAITLPAFILVNTVGIDGVSNGIEVGNYMASARFSWWCDPPTEWAPLQAWHNEAIQVFERLLPSSTPYLRKNAP